MKRCRLLMLAGLLALVALACRNPMGPEGTAGLGAPEQEPSAGRLAFGGSSQAFLWGVATSGYQSEGFASPDDDHTQWRDWVEARGLTPVGHGTGFFVDEKYAEDIELAREMGARAFRISIEWARLEPTRGAPYDFTFYDAVIRAITDAGMEPLVTLLHFTYPDWVDGACGWDKPGRIFPPKLPPAVQAYLDFVDKVVSRYRTQVRYWITFNEPNTWVPAGWMLGVNPPGKTDLRATIQVAQNVILAHRLAYDHIHFIFGDRWRLRKRAQVSANVYCLGFQPLPPRFEERTFQADWVYPAIADTVDFVSLDYYFRFHTLQEALGVFGQPWLYPSDPQGLADAITQYWGRYHKPILIAENGMATFDGAKRVDGLTRSQYLTDHVDAMLVARQAGAEVMGYLHWSITDNWEWGQYHPRMGLYFINYADLERTPAPDDPDDPSTTYAVNTYKEIIENNP